MDVIPRFVDLSLPALSTPPGLDAAGRRAWVRDATDDELVAAIVPMVEALARIEPVAMAGLPAGEVFASPWALRAVALAAGAGAWAAHHELRHQIEWPEDFGDDDAVHSEAHGVWSRGVLEIGKYRSFLQDEPLTVYNPNHMAKWAPHELLHRAGLYFWRADATAWELYVTARLNELVPVVTWYGVDQILRRGGGAFDRSAWAARPAAPLSEATWRHEASIETAVRRDVALLRRTVAHFERELAAVDEELRRWRPVPTPEDGLDASSDAIAYVVGHRARLRDRSTVRLMERALSVGVHYDTTVAAYRQRVESLFDAAVFGAVEVDAGRARARATGRWLHDVLHRAATCGWETFKRVVPLLEDARDALGAAASGLEAVDVSAWDARLRERLSPTDAHRVLSVGSGAATDRPQLLDGVMSIAPRTALALDLDDPDGDALRALASWPGHWDRAPLAERLARWMTETGAARPHLELLKLERAIADADRRADDAVERLCVPAEALPDDFDGVVVRNEAFTIEWFAVDVLTWHTDPEAPVTDDHEATALLVGAYLEGVSILPAPAAVRALWDALERGGMDVGAAWRQLDEALAEAPLDPHLPDDADTWLDELLAAGALGFVPASRSST